jgi:hypothetical protein
LGYESRKERREKEEQREKDIEAWNRIPKAERQAKLD